MPVILPRDRRNAWLDAATPPEALAGFLAPFPAGQMRAYPVSSAVSNARNDYPDLIKPVPADGFALEA